MKKRIINLLIIILAIPCFITIKAEDTVGKQFFKNIHLGWDINKTYDYRWSNFYLGTEYERKFATDSRAFWQIGANFNWSKYTLYNDGAFALSSHNDIVRTQSISFPFLVGYTISKTFFHGLKVYTGPTYEMILSSKLNGNDFSGLRLGQFGWTVGTKIRFLAIFSARLAYNYYPTGLFENGNLNRSAVSFSIGF